MLPKHLVNGEMYQVSRAYCVYGYTTAPTELTTGTLKLIAPKSYLLYLGGKKKIKRLVPTYGNAFGAKDMIKVSTNYFLFFSLDLSANVWLTQHEVEGRLFQPEVRYFRGTGPDPSKT